MDECTPPWPHRESTAPDESDRAFDEWLRQGEEAVDRGDFVTHEAMTKKLRERWRKDSRV
jgi:predicted transcriptional regulator